MDGRALLAGIDLDDLPYDRALNVITALAVDDQMPRWSAETKKGLEVYDRRRVRAELLESLGGATPGLAPAATARERAAQRWNPDTWGTLPEHQAGQRAVMAMVGGL
ncbi:MULTISPECIES: hypothetical protein [Actinomycetes]|uniref:Uncharacterized protein n=1 Tax=Parafrankia colletiae TaxID=573497 RepID=A0A1S1R6C1_9ACTN|nr:MULTISPECIES: hypothetical protein [Actinomycetes]MCK9901290.1 hypothetical protein [Frankia sp. Cpl3]OHV41045.1 hypothetical protein CC117_33315 [Parafrankia colletiae]TLK48137.1 hypothetical protein FDN03_15395 [Glutamicibacter sp. V16R2B1]